MPETLPETAVIILALYDQTRGRRRDRDFARFQISLIAGRAQDVDFGGRRVRGLYSDLPVDAAHLDVRSGRELIGLAYLFAPVSGGPSKIARAEVAESPTKRTRRRRD